MSAEPVAVPRAAPALVITPGPHLRTETSTRSIMWWVNLSLTPATLWGVLVFGLNALFVVLASIAGAVAAEALATRLQKRRPTIGDGSAVCTGLLLALTLPPLVPWWVAALGAAFSILVVKSMFGGLGYNLFNPALAGRAFLMASFPLAMTAGWSPPRPGFLGALDGVTTATPLAALKEHGPIEAARVLMSPEAPWLSMVLGLRPGSIGEVSVVLIAVGAGVLVMRGIIGLAIPLSVIAGTMVVTAFSGQPLMHLMGGGLWLGAFFMATDYVTSPGTRSGQIVFGLVIGLLTGVIRLYGGYPEGICYAILIANTLVPALDLWFRPRRAAAAGAPS